MELKERLAQLRRSHGYSLRELRERIKRETDEVMAISYLSALERDERAPSIDALSRIAAGYGLTLEELLRPVTVGGTEQPQFSPNFAAFAAKRNLSNADQEELWRIQFRGERPETEDEWELLFLALNRIGQGRRQ